MSATNTVCDPDRIWMTPRQVADLFGVTPRTVARWIDDGDLPGYRLPGRRGDRRVLRSRLLDFIRRHPQYALALEPTHGSAAARGPDHPAGYEAESGGEDWCEDAPPGDGDGDDGGG